MLMMIIIMTSHIILIFLSGLMTGIYDPILLAKWRKFSIFNEINFLK